MSNKNSFKEKKCVRCGGEGTKSIKNRTWYCDKHLRHERMREHASSKNKPVPTRDVLESISPKDMICVVCNTKMVWRGPVKAGKGSLKNVASLQHDDNGEFRIICVSCNSKHARTCRDLIYTQPPGTKYCKSCASFKPEQDFYKMKITGRLASYCKPCHVLASKKTYFANWESRKLKMRIYKQKIKRNGKPK